MDKCSCITLSPFITALVLLISHISCYTDIDDVGPQYALHDDTHNNVKYYSLSHLDAILNEHLRTKRHAEESSQTENYVDVITDTNRRVKRQSVRNTGSQMSNGDATEIVALHNEYRAKRGAADMEYMVWNNDLAEMAQDWADLCVYEHGQPDNVPYSGSIGQNLHASSGRVEVSGGFLSWHNEINSYTLNTGACSGVCGHYTQIVWSATKEVGCAINDCRGPNGLTGVSWSNGGYYMVCNYGPVGNVGSEKPYTVGDPCSACKYGKSWCFEEQFCRNSCVDNNSPCTCLDNCQACGVMDSSTCTCQCQIGTTGAVCADECVQTHPNCDPPRGQPGWPKSQCNNAQWGATIRLNCPVMCGVCTEVSKRSKGGCGATTTSIPPTTTTKKKTTTKKPIAPTSCGCENGGISKLSRGKCAGCICTVQWQGSKCTKNRAQALRGITFDLNGVTSSKFRRIWEDVMSVYFANEINMHCNDKAHKCCKGALKKESYSDLKYVSKDGVKVGDNYPEEIARKVLEVLIYTTPLNPNPLCLTALARRKKRQAPDVSGTDLELSLDQAVLQEIIDLIAANMSAILLDCCNATIENIQLAVVENTTVELDIQPVDDPESDVPVGVIATGAVLGAVLIITALVITVVFCNRQDFIARNSDSTLTGNSKSGYAYSESRPNIQPSPASTYYVTESHVPSHGRETFSQPSYDYYMDGRADSYYSTRVPSVYTPAEPWSYY